MNQELKEFYRAYLKYLKGEENLYGFQGHMGLCRALLQWGTKQSMGIHRINELLEAMKQQFRDAGLDFVLPFNNCMSEWQAEHRSHRMNFNYRRIAWVTKGAA
jgi:hypothetical protein